MNYELYHHGILGMHWGIRRYQNEDGSLTEAGKRRYNSRLKDLKTIGEADKKVHDMSNDIQRALDDTLEGVTPLFTRDVKESYEKALSDYKKEAERLIKKYGDRIDSYSRSMDDGYDYVVYALNDPKLSGTIEYFAYPKQKTK